MRTFRFLSLRPAATPGVPPVPAGDEHVDPQCPPSPLLARVGDVRSRVREGLAQEAWSRPDAPEAMRSASATAAGTSPAGVSENQFGTEGTHNRTSLSGHRGGHDDDLGPRTAHH